MHSDSVLWRAAALGDDALYLVQELKQQAATLSSLREASMLTKRACS